MLRILLALFLAYIALLVVAYFLQSRLVHLPHIPGRALIGSPADIRIPYEVVEVTTEDGVRLHGWWVPAEQPRGTLLFFHGNAGNISHRLETISIFHSLGLNIFIFDYRGYGQSTGRPTEKGLYRDGEAAYRYLVEERGIAPGEIVFFGRSLGGAVAARTATVYPARGLILESTFTSVPDLGAELYRFLPVRLLARLRYDTRAHLAQTDIPVLIIHSEEDEIIPYHHAEALAATAGPRGRLVTIQGDHNTGFLQAGRSYRQALDAFLDEVLGPRSG